MKGPQFSRRKDRLDVLVLILDPQSLWYDAVATPRLTSLLRRDKILKTYWVPSVEAWRIHAGELGYALSELLTNRVAFEIRVKNQDEDSITLYEDAYGYDLR